MPRIVWWLFSLGNDQLQYGKILEGTLNKLSAIVIERKQLLAMLHSLYKDILCLNPKDKIYALQTMASETILPVNYAIHQCELYWKVLAHYKSHGPQFSDTLRQCLRISIETL
jgi:hypothetical protein